MLEALTAMFAGVGMLVGGVMLMVFALFYVVPIWPCWQIAKRAGFSPIWSILIVVPVANLIIMWVFAFSRWPNEGNGPGIIDVTAFGTNSQLENRQGGDRG